MSQSTEALEGFEARMTDLVIRLVILAVFVYWSLSLVRPFLPIFIWAVILAVALFPVYAGLTARLGGRPRLAATLITLAALIVVLGPVAALSASMIETVQTLSAAIHQNTFRVPPPPRQIADWPVIGDDVHAAWAMAATNLDAAIESYSPAIRPFVARLLVAISGIGGDVIKLSLATILMGFLFGAGKGLARLGQVIVSRIIAARGVQFVDLAGATIRNVSRGVVGVALLQAILAGIVLQVAGAPAAGLLAFLILILSIIQIGPVFVIVPAVIWAWATMTTGHAIVFTLVLLPIGLLDNVLKPILMARGMSTPPLVIFLGVLGGTITYGLTGLFLGPIILAIFYDLVVTWSRHQKQYGDISASAD